ncbi:MAG: calcium-binding protein [Pseudomonadota bacterium]
MNSALLTAAVLLATQLEAANADDSEAVETAPERDDAISTGANPGFDSFTVASILETVSESDTRSLPIEVAAIGNSTRYDNPASIEFVSEKGLPRGFVTQSPDVTDPYIAAAEPLPGIAPVARNFQPSQSVSVSTPLADGNEEAEVSEAPSITLPSEILEASGLLPVLLANGIDIQQGPGGLVTLGTTPGQVQQLAQILTAIIGATPPAQDNEDAAPIPDVPLNLEGTAEDDLLTGGSADDSIFGFSGNDVLYGLGGGDLLNGDLGNDTAEYETSPDAVFIDLANTTATGGDAEGDTLISIENLGGSAFNDSLFGDSAANEFVGRAGGDHIDGRGGSDTASYTGSDAGVVISLLEDTASGGHAEGDELDDIENLNGTLFDDVLEGDNGDNRLGGHHGIDALIGHGGNDTLLGGNLADFINGGDGIDTADYTASTEAVSVNLLTDQNTGGEAEGDRLVSIENLAGSAHDDLLTGDHGDNRLTGRDGNDSLFGNGGNDRLIGGLGADLLDGGDGNRDAADYSNASEAVGVDLLFGGFLGEANGDTFNSVEFVVGSDFDDIIIGNSAINRLDGGAGDDDLDGDDGNDTLVGGIGNDTLTGGEGNDVFIFEANFGHDTITDFEAGPGRTDRIWLRDHEFEDFDDLAASLEVTDFGTMLAVDGNASIFFEGIHSSELVSDDFILA